MINQSVMNSNLKYIFKPKPLPERLIYRKTIDFFGTKIDHYTMFETKKNTHNHAIMLLFPQLIERDGLKSVPSLYIWRLISSNSGNGLGTAMLNFAKHCSRQAGCNGNFHLYAGVDMAPNRVPHIFYKKYGMNTADIKINNKLDKFIQEKRNATQYDFTEMCMYYPPVKVNEKISIFQKALKTLKTFFSI